MSFRKDVDEMMQNVQVDYEMTNNIMNNTVRNSGKKYRGFRKKAIVVVTLATLCIGTMAVGVSGFSGAWNNIVQLIQHKGIEMDETQAVNFSKKGYIDVADADKVTATNNGIKVSLIQTISDKKAIYLYLKVKSEDKKLNNGMSFVGAKINIKGFGNIDGVAGDLNVTSDYEGVFEVRMDVLSEYKEKNLDIDGKDITPDSYDIDVENVEFSYDKRKTIDGISVHIPQKTSTAIVGPSGGGKTTLCHLIARFWDVDRGCVRLGGMNVKDYSMDSLMKNFSFVFQSVYLFQDTIANNICFGQPDAPMEKVMEAAKKACCHDFIMALPDGYETIIGEGGANLSGGEKQRISIARAMLKDAPIIILDVK